MPSGCTLAAGFHGAGRARIPRCRSKSAKQGLPLRGHKFRQFATQQIQTSSRARTIHMARSSMPARERASGEAALQKWDSLATSMRQADLRIGRRERHCSPLLRPVSRIDGKSVVKRSPAPDRVTRRGMLEPLSNVGFRARLGGSSGVPSNRASIGRNRPNRRNFKSAIV
jgi:hypothetical protein